MHLFRRPGTPAQFHIVGALRMMSAYGPRISTRLASLNPCFERVLSENLARRTTAPDGLGDNGSRKRGTSTLVRTSSARNCNRRSRTFQMKSFRLRAHRALFHILGVLRALPALAPHTSTRCRRPGTAVSSCAADLYSTAKSGLLPPRDSAEELRASIDFSIWTGRKWAPQHRHFRTCSLRVRRQPHVARTAQRNPPGEPSTLHFHPAQFRVAGDPKAPPARSPHTFTRLLNRSYLSTRVKRKYFARRPTAVDGLDENRRQTRDGSARPQHARTCPRESMAAR